MTGMGTLGVQLMAGIGTLAVMVYDWHKESDK